MNSQVLGLIFIGGIGLYFYSKNNQKNKSQDEQPKKDDPVIIDPVKPPEIPEKNFFMKEVDQKTHRDFQPSDVLDVSHLLATTTDYINHENVSQEMIDRGDTWSRETVEHFVDSTTGKEYERRTWYGRMPYDNSEYTRDVRYAYPVMKSK